MKRNTKGKKPAKEVDEGEEDEEEIVNGKDEEDDFENQQEGDFALKRFPEIKEDKGFVTFWYKHLEPKGDTSDQEEKNSIIRFFVRKVIIRSI